MQTLLTRAAAGFDAAEMDLHAAVTRYRLGQLLGGSGGAELRRAAGTWMLAQGIREPERMVQVLAPGFALP